MDINTWFESGCNYQQGITLYASLKGHSPNLLRLFIRKESLLNADKLKYELGKYRKTKTSVPAILETTQKQEPSQTSVKAPLKTTTPKGFYRLNELHIDLHPMAQKQRANFQEAISKHLQLIKLHPKEEGVALNLCIEIEDLFDAIETTQEVLDHYVKHKVVLNIEPRNFKQLTAPQLLRSRNNKSTSVSKYKKKVEALKLQLRNDLPKAKKTKIKIALEKAESKLLHHKLELQQLNELINANE